MAGKFTPQNRGALIQRFASGCTIPDACSAVGISEKTVKGWLTRGRREDGSDSDYAQFADAVDEAREAAKVAPEPMTEEEHRLAVSKSARLGNLKALDLYWKMLQADKAANAGATDDADPMAEFDELAERRVSRAA